VFSAQNFRYLDESGVPAMVTVGVVDRFKVVDVQYKDRQRVIIPLGSFEFVVEFFFHRTAIVKAGQWINLGLMFQVPLVFDDPSSNPDTREKLGK